MSGEVEKLVLTLLDQCGNASLSPAGLIAYLRDHGIKEGLFNGLKRKSPAVHSEYMRVRCTDRKQIDTADIVHGEQRRFLAAAQSRKISMTDYARRIASHPSREHSAEIIAIVELLADHIDYLQDHVEQLQGRVDELTGQVKTRKT